MNLLVAYNSRGQILVAMESGSGAYIQARLEAKPGVNVGEFELPAEFSGKKPHEYLPHLHVDVATRSLVKAHK